MDYSIDYENDHQRQWEDAFESANDHLERLLCDLIMDIPKLSETVPFPNCTSDWYLDAYIRRVESVVDVARYISTGDMMGYAERYIGDPDSDKGGW